MTEFERKLIQGVHDDRWTGKITGFRSSAGVREYPIEPDDQDVNPDRSVPVVVFTADALAAELRKAKAEALEEFAEKWATQDGIEALMFATDDVSAVQLTEKVLLASAAAYRADEMEGSEYE